MKARTSKQRHWQNSTAYKQTWKRNLARYLSFFHTIIVSYGFIQSFADRSCRETLQWLYSHGHINRATDMQNKLGVQSTVGYHWRAQAHAEHAQWPALDQLIKSKHISHLVIFINIYTPNV